MLHMPKFLLNYQSKFSKGRGQDFSISPNLFNIYMKKTRGTGNRAAKELVYQSMKIIAYCLETMLTIKFNSPRYR